MLLIRLYVRNLLNIHLPKSTSACAAVNLTVPDTDEQNHYEELFWGRMKADGSGMRVMCVKSGPDFFKTTLLTLHYHSPTHQQRTVRVTADRSQRKISHRSQNASSIINNMHSSAF